MKYELTINVFKTTIRIDRYATRPFPIRSWPWPDVKFSKWPFMVKLYLVHSTVSKREMRCWQNECRVFINSKVIAENFSRKKLLFLEFLLSGAQTVNCKSNLRKFIERAVKELSNAPFRGALSLLVLELCADLYKLLKTAKFELWWPLATWHLTWPKNWQSLSVIIFDALSIAAYRVSLYVAQEPS